MHSNYHSDLFLIIPIAHFHEGKSHEKRAPYCDPGDPKPKLQKHHPLLGIPCLPYQLQVFFESFYECCQLCDQPWSNIHWGKWKEKKLLVSNLPDMSVRLYVMYVTPSALSAVWSWLSSRPPIKSSRHTPLCCPKTLMHWGTNHSMSTSFIHTSCNLKELSPTYSQETRL